MRFKCCLLLVVIFLLLFNSLGAAANSHKYVLWSGIEPDKCGVAWLVKRFVDQKAEFKFVAQGTMVKKGTPLDTPTSGIQRKKNKPAFAVALNKYNLTQPELKRISKIIWDIEINNWEKNKTEAAAGLSTIIQGLAKDHNNPEQALKKSFMVYDALYAGLGGEL